MSFPPFTCSPPKTIHEYILFYIYISFLNQARGSYNVIKNSHMVCDVSCLGGVMVLWGVSVLQIVIYYNCKAHTKLISNDNNSPYYIPFEIVAF